MLMADRDAFLRRFFSGDNRIQWDSILAGDPSVKEIWPWAERLLQDLPGPTLLPYRDGTGTTWYALVLGDSLAYRRLIEDLQAFVGPTWSSLGGAPPEFLPTTDLERDLHALAGGKAFKFRGIPSPGGNRSLGEALDRMRRVWSRRVDREAVLPHATDRLLRDFHMALTAGNRQEAERCLDALQQGQRLGSQNLLFLRVQMLHELGRPTEILALGEWEALLATRRPMAVTEALVEAVYTVHLMTHEQQGDVAGAVTAYRDHLRPRYGALAAYVADSRQPSCLKLRALQAVTDEVPRPERVNALIEAASDEATRHHLRAILAWLPAAAPVATTTVETEDPLVRAREALDEGDFDRAYALAHALPPSERQVRILAECADEFGTLEAEQTFLTAFGALPGEAQDRLCKARRLLALVDRLTTVAATEVAATVPADWFQWYQAVLADPSWSQALYVAVRGAREWFLRDLEDPHLRALSAGLKHHPEPVHRVMVEAMPHLIQAVLNEATHERYVDLYTALRDLLVVEGSCRASERKLYLDLTEALLVVGVDARSYRDLLESVRDMVDLHVSVNTVEWVLDLLELLVLHPCGDPVARTGTFSHVSTLLRPMAARLEPLQASALAQVSSEVGLEGLISDWPVVSEPDVGAAHVDWSQLAGRKVLIYCIQELYGRRAADVLARQCPEARITIAFDHAGNATFKARIQEAEVIVMHTWHSKHAATGFIEMHRRPPTVLLRPEGKGTTGIVRELEKFCLVP